MTDAEIIVIGNGLFGAATTRHLAEAGREVLCIGARAIGGDGPARPEGSWPTHRVYSSHNDAARLTRRQDRNPVWAEITARAIDGYQEIERRSGISFHEPVGCLISSRPGGDGVENDPLEIMGTTGVDHELFDVGDATWRARWPQLAVPDSHYVAFEPAPAGLLRPRRLIEAQNTLAQASSARIVEGTVTAIARRGPGGFDVVVDDGTRHTCDQVVVAAGAFTNLHDLLPGVDPPALSLKSEVIVLGEVSGQAATELAEYPTVKYLVDPGDLQSIYMTPPVRFDDGRHYVKLGANTRLDHWMTTLDEVQRWFNTGTDPAYLPLFEPALRALWPGVDFVSISTRPCIITYTPDRIPLIESVADGLFVITAGNGGGAKGSDAWGERAAAMVLG